MTIAEFIAARLDELEVFARSAADIEGADWGAADPCGDGEPDRVEGTGVTAVAYDMAAAAARHVAVNDPACVLRRVDRDRRVLARHSVVPPTPGVFMVGASGARPGETCAGCGWRGNGQGPTAWPCIEVRDLAEVWADHPDYQQEWSA